MTFFEQILLNHVLLAGIFGWFFAQIAKTIIHAIINKSLDWSRMTGDGGMPSCHSSTVTAMAIISLLEYGPASFQFGITTMLATIVMHDAMGVRLETGKQAKILNEMMELFASLGKDQLKSEEQLKELVGHTPLQVFCGFLFGIIVALVYFYCFI